MPKPMRMIPMIEARLRFFLFFPVVLAAAMIVKKKIAKPSRIRVIPNSVIYPPPTLFKASAIHLIRSMNLLYRVSKMFVPANLSSKTSSPMNARIAMMIFPAVPFFLYLRAKEPPHERQITAACCNGVDDATNAEQGDDRAQPLPTATLEKCSCKLYEEENVQNHEGERDDGFN